ncbi:uncharacterized protein LOC120419322 [Culex pipiens pallens]|uniref:uncharacterized protein LOC120419322 n=1 Tax=Culex pipiens pallens TaxID=42434 RepID=UPI001953CF37|nr:uncharacterized protein LOC120419322 [Culex pipiens pallens]XP_039437928.1 uncharacterized protein LOC120419322 [Culex pipiens pallens]
MEARLQCHTRQPHPTGPDHRECRDHHHDLAKIRTTRRRLHTTKLPAFCQLQLQANYIHQLIHGRIVDSPDALAEVYNCLRYFSRLIVYHQGRDVQVELHAATAVRQSEGRGPGISAQPAEGRPAGNADRS